MELLKFWKEKIVEIDKPEREKPSLGLLLENEPKNICVLRSEKRFELRLVGEETVLITNLGVVWKLLIPS